MIAKLRVIVQDPLIKDKDRFATENVKTEEEPFFLDGPVAKRVAIIDRNSETGRLTTAAADGKPVKATLTPA